MGVAFGPSDGADCETLLRNADLALYRAKEEGKGTFRFFEPDMNARLQARRDLERDLRKALEHGEFELHFQPLIELETHRVGFDGAGRQDLDAASEDARHAGQRQPDGRELRGGPRGKLRCLGTMEHCVRAHGREDDDREKGGSR